MSPFFRVAENMQRFDELLAPKRPKSFPAF
jgi:hypothetical protein